MKIAYIKTHFKSRVKKILGIAETIIVEWEKQGFRLTLRQLYYQMVAGGHISNNLRSYKNLGEAISRARLAGIIDWDSIVDRVRGVRENLHYVDAKHAHDDNIEQFGMDLREDQDRYIEVWVEKDALTGILAKACEPHDVPYFCCRGYTSQTAMHDAALRITHNSRGRAKPPIIIHLGDHDPSGMDMSRDIYQRLEMFTGGIKVIRIALNMDQIERFKPPPNPAKVTDSRFKAYMEQYGHESWELDAMKPKYLVDLIQRYIRKFTDAKKFKAAQQAQEAQRGILQGISDHWAPVLKVVSKGAKHGKARNPKANSKVARKGRSKGTNMRHGGRSPAKRRVARTSARKRPEK